MKQKIILFFITILFLALIGFNANFLDKNNLFSDDSFIALMSIIATSIGLLLIWIFILAQKLIKK